ncbi:MAG: YqgE/AlgH family protein [Bacteroidales bacterium]
MKIAEDFLNVKPTEFKLTAGRILISVPFYNDPFFNRSVVLLTDYDESSCAGLIINRESKYSVREIVSEIKVDDHIYIGGPVLPEGLFALHDFENSKQSTKLVPGVYTGFDEILLSLIEHHAIENLNYKFFVGYAGWSPGQLEEELKKKMWVIGAATPELVFKTPANKIWEQAVRYLGPDYLHWIRVPKIIESN